MKGTISDTKGRRYIFITVLEIIMLTFLMPVCLSDAAAFAYITNSGDDTVSVFDTLTDSITATINVGYLPFGIAASPDGKEVFVANYLSNNVSVIDAATDTVTAAINVGALPFGVAINPDGKKLYVANFASDNISVIDTKTNTVIAGINTGKGPWGIAVSPDGKKVYSVNLKSNSTSVIDTTTNKVIGTIYVGKGPWGVEVSPDGKKAFVTNSYNNTVSVIDTTSNTVTSVINVGNNPWGISVSPDGAKAYVANSGSNTVSVIDTTTNTVIATVKVGSLPSGIAVNSEGTKVYVVNSDSSNVSIIDTATNTVKATLKVGSMPVTVGKLVVPQLPVLPIANFSSNTTSGSAPLSVQFMDFSKNATAWKWDFGDGTNSSAQSPVHIFSGAGNYSVSLTASNSNGTDLKLAIITVIIQTVTIQPVADFSSNVTGGYIPLSVQFTDKSKSASTRNWDFGDGTSSTQQNPTHIYSAAGNYTVNLTVSNANGINSKLVVITAASKSVLPVADFSSNVTNGIVPLFVQFTDKSKNASEWRWNFGDGTNSTLNSPTHTYSSAGNYLVTLTVNNINGTDSKSGSISAVKEETVSSFPVKYRNRLREYTPEDVLSNYSFIDVGGLNGVGKYRDVVWFDMNGLNSATPIYNATLSLTWYYQSRARLNDTVIEIYRPASTWNTGYTSWNKRDKNVAWSNQGGDWYDKNGIMRGSAPYATFTLKASSQPSNSYCNFDVTNLVMQYATGKYSNTGFFIKARTESNNYVAFRSADCSLYLSTSVLPTAGFSTNVTNGTVPLSVKFNDLSKNATEWNWNFGDGGTSTYQNPVHIYSAAGNYTVNLTALNGNGTNSKLATITVQKSVPAITWSNPADISYGTALSSTQLKASAAVPGTFVYTPAAGTLLSVGTQTLHVDFTPDDTANYTMTSRNVTINVLAQQTITETNTYNNRMREASPEVVLSDYSYIDVGGISGVGKYRDVIWFDLNGLNSTTQINNATLSLIWYYPNTPRLNDTVIEIYRPASAWNSSYLSWNKRDKNIGWSNPGGDWYDKNNVLQGPTPYATLILNASSLPNNSSCEYDVSNLIREYTSGKYSNTGFLIKARTESENYIAFYSAQCGNANNVPKLKLVYS